MADDWKAALPDDLKANPAIVDFKDVSSIVKSFIETKALVGASIRPPSADASPEDRKAFREKMLALDAELAVVAPDDRVPKEAKEYAPPAGVELSNEALEALRSEAAADGISRKAFQARAKRASDAFALDRRVKGEAREALKKELGNAFDERLGLAAAAAEKMGYPAELVRSLKAGEVDLPTYKVMANIAKAFGEPGQLGAQPGGGLGRRTPAELDITIAELRADPAYQRGDRAKVARMNELAAERYPDEAR